MRIAVGLPQIASDPVRAVRAAVEAEAAGAWGVWCFDHLQALGEEDRPVLDGWGILGPVAGATSRVRIVSLVTRVGLRPPALVARMAAVAQAASGGRFVLGLGVGDAGTRAEERRFGVSAPPERAARRDALEATVDELGRPRGPVRPLAAVPPVWVGGTAPDLVDFARRRADAWHGWELEPQTFAERSRDLDGTQRWWGGIFEPSIAERRLAELREAGADGVTWMIPSAREDRDRPALLELVSAVSSR